MSDISNDALAWAAMDDCNLDSERRYARAALAARRERDEARAELAKLDDVARIIWEPRAVPADLALYREMQTSPGAAWILGRLGSMLGEARVAHERVRDECFAWIDAERSVRAEVGRLRAVLRWLEREEPLERLSFVMRAAAAGQWDVVSAEAQGESDAR